MKKSNQTHYCMKKHIGVDAHLGLVHTPVDTAAKVHDITQAVRVLHGQKSALNADPGFRSMIKRAEIIETHSDVNRHVAMMPGNRQALDRASLVGQLTEALEKTKAGIGGNVEQPFRVVKVLLGHAKGRYRRLATNNTAQFTALFALSNLWMVPKRPMQMQQA